MTTTHLGSLTEPVRRGLSRSGNSWRNELLYLTMAGIEILWVIPWLIPVLPGASDLRGAQIAAFAAFHFLAALVLSRVLIRRRVSDGVLRTGFLIGLLAGMFITLRFVLPLDTLGAEPPAFAEGKLFFSPVLLIVIVVGWLWVRGQSVAMTTITPARAGFGLRLGIIILIGAALVPDDRMQRAVLLILPPFFFVGLLSLSLARAASLRVSREMQRSPFGMGWIGLVMLIGGGISVLGFGAALVFGGTNFDAILGIFGAIIGGIIQLVAAIFLPIAEAIANLLASLFGSLSGLASRLTQIQATVNKLGATPGPPNSFATIILHYLPTACLLLGFLIAVLILLVTMRNRARRDNLGDEEHESLSSDAILNSLKATLRRALDAARDALGSLNFGADAANRFTIRRLYARLCGLAAKNGFPRGDSQTPDEYQTVLIEAFPDFRREVQLLTNAYIHAHYGELPDDPDMVARIREALDRIASAPQHPA